VDVSNFNERSNLSPQRTFAQAVYADQVGQPGVEANFAVVMPFANSEQQPDQYQCLMGFRIANIE